MDTHYLVDYAIYDWTIFHLDLIVLSHQYNTSHLLYS